MRLPLVWLFRDHEEAAPSWEGCFSPSELGHQLLSGNAAASIERRGFFVDGEQRAGELEERLAFISAFSCFKGWAFNGAECFNSSGPCVLELCSDLQLGFQFVQLWMLCALEAIDLMIAAAAVRLRGADAVMGWQTASCFIWDVWRLSRSL